MKFTEDKLGQAFIELLGNENFPHFLGNTISRADEGVKKTFDFAKYLRNSFPNATFIGFTGTPTMQL